MIIKKDHIEITPEEIRALFNMSPSFFIKWILENMERITGVKFEYKKE